MARQSYDKTELDRLSRALLRLHKALLDGERVTYERVHGRISSNGEFLQLLLGHAWFAWLRQLSQAMAKLDELAESTEPNARDTLLKHVASLRMLLMPSETGEGFGRKYFEALRRDPEVMVAHATVKELLS